MSDHAPDSRGETAPAQAMHFSVHGPLFQQGETADLILRALPAWFGIQDARARYVEAVDELETFVALPPGPPCAGQVIRPDKVIGFVALRETSRDALEVHVMGVLPAWHRRGAGRQLVERCATYARAEGYSLLHVKTLAPSHPDTGYAATRAFYEALGFRPLEELPQVWGPENPCLLLVRPL
jgi:GNAT superfamily N-acetyltransferase